jgi:multiple antibiotic resistance protein
VATIVFVRQADTAAEMLALAAGIVAVHLVLWIFLRFSVVIIRVLRDSGVTLITRIAGLLLSAIAVQLVADAVAAFVDSA